jgi:soluble lytic murein transglycosylase-like protein
MTAHWAVIVLYARALHHFNPSLQFRAAMRLADATIAQSDRERIDARLLVALIAVESRWHPDAVSNAGALGLGQLMPETANAMGVDANDPLQNIAGAAYHLRRLLDRFAARDRETRYRLALAAYNAGLGAVERYGGVPPYPETIAYVGRVMVLWHRLAGD